MNRILLQSRIHEDDMPGTAQNGISDYPYLCIDSAEPWQEEWRFHLDQENPAEIRGYLQFGGRLNLKEHFLPRAKTVCSEHNLILIRVEGFQASVNLGKNLYTVSALVTIQRNPDERT